MPQIREEFRSCTSCSEVRTRWAANKQMDRLPGGHRAHKRHRAGGSAQYPLRCTGSTPVLIVALLVIGVMSFLAPHGRGTGYRHNLLELHTSIALVALPFILARLLWRMRYGKPRSHGNPHPVAERIADVVWPLLLIGIVLQLLTGPFLYQTHHLPIKLFGFTVVPPLLPRMEDLYTILQRSHEWIGFALLGLVALHVAGALKHLLIERDGVFSRMLWPHDADAGNPCVLAGATGKASTTTEPVTRVV